MIGMDMKTILIRRRYVQMYGKDVRLLICIMCMFVYVYVLRCTFDGLKCTVMTIFGAPTPEIIIKGLCVPAHQLNYKYVFNRMSLKLNIFYAPLLNIIMVGGDPNLSV